VTQAKNEKQGKSLNIRGKIWKTDGGADGDRTHDLLTASQALGSVPWF